MSREAKQLLKKELNKNREIKKLESKQDNDDRTLDLTNANLSTSVFQKMIRDYTALETLDLSENNIGNDGAKNIAAMIEENKTIKSLKLTNCQIGTKGL